MEYFVDINELDFSELSEYLPDSPLINNVPKIVRQNAFNVYREVMLVENVYRSLDSVIDDFEEINLKDIKVLVKLDVLSEKKIKLILNLV